MCVCVYSCAIGAPFPCLLCDWATVEYVREKKTLTCPQASCIIVFFFLVCIRSSRLAIMLMSNATVVPRLCVCVCVFFTISSPTLYRLIYHLISYVNIATACLLIYVATEIFETSSRAARVITRREPRRAAPLLSANPRDAARMNRINRTRPEAPPP